jgi:serine/threonine protein kinase
MAQALDNLPGGEASILWQQLSECLDAFVSAWQQSGESPPVLADFLPASPAALRRMALVEAIKVDLEYRWQQQGWPKTVEQYVAEFPELSADGLPCDVIYEEYHVRKQRGDTVSIDDYCRRFPEVEGELRRLFELESPEKTSAMVATEPAPTFAPGEQIDDFDLLATLGKGAFATVFLARQRSMQRLVALKVSRDKGFEPQTLAQLDHPNIVRVFDQRQLTAHKLRLLYMQYIAGGTLQSVVEHVRRIPPEVRNGGAMIDAIDAALELRGEQPPTDSMTRHRLRKASWPEVVCWLGSRLAGALAYAHGRGVLHRDVKPANVLVGADGSPKLADFNISFSKLDGATPAAYFGGSLAYMSPEQLEACDPAHPRKPEDLDGRCDVYSLGVLLWELLALKRPFAEDAMPHTWSRALSKMTGIRRKGVTAETVASLPRGCPQIVVDVLLKSLDPDPAKRHASAAELARELDLCLQPRAHQLLHERGSLRSFLKRHPVSSTIAIGLLPNIVMCVLNVVYNLNEIMKQLSLDDQKTFFAQIGVINAVCYSIGLGYVFASRGEVFRALARLARGDKVEPPPTSEMVRRLLTFGAVTAGITAALWGISGFIFPAWTEYGAGANSRVTVNHYLHFIVSNALCGLIAATQSYFVVTFLSVRNGYPWLMRARAADADDVSDLAAVARRGRIALALAVAIPFLAIFAVLALEEIDSGVIGSLAGLGLLGCGLAYVLDLTIRGDLTALAAVINPSTDPLAGSDSLDSRLSASHR